MKKPERFTFTYKAVSSGHNAYLESAEDDSGVLPGKADFLKICGYISLNMFSQVSGY